MKLVLDASAVLAWLHGEPGGEQVSAHLPDACISSVNWSEVVQKSLARKGISTKMGPLIKYLHISPSGVT